MDEDATLGPTPASPHPRRKRFANRSRTGCLSCRSRRKRCDEGKPVCANCHRVNVPCEWATPTLLNQSKRPDKKSDTTYHGRSDSPKPTSHDRYCANDIVYASNSQPFSMVPSYAMSSGPAITLEQRYLLTYYMHTLVPIFSVFTGSTTYHTSLYIPMAFDSPGVLNAILARSASHLAMTNVEADRIAHFTQLATFHQLLCHQYLQQCVFNVGDPSSTSDEIIATVMLLIALETQNGTKNQKYMKQLQCARKIVATRGGPRHFIDAGWEAQCVFGHFLYHEVMVSIMNEVEDNAANGSSHDAGGPITNLGTDSMPIDWNSSYTVDLGPRIDPLMGLSSSLFLKIRQISLLKRLPPGCNERNQLFLTLEHEITEWCVQQDYAAGKRVNGLDLAAQMDLIALAETCRLAALILLYRTSDRHFDILVKLAKQIMEFVARIPDGNQVEAGLLFPLFLAGGELLAWTEMEACAIRLSRIKERTRFMNILDVEEVLERVWRSRLNGIQSDWVQVLIEEHRLVHVA